MVRHGRIILLVIIGVLLLVGGASAYLAGYGYYQDVTLNNTGSNLTNYQMMFVVNTSSGTSSGTTIYLNSHAESDLDDLRFTDTSDTLYDYWIESSSTSSPYNVWVEVPSILAGNSTMRVQYDNAAASAVSNGTNTFSWFDDFPGSSLDTSKWEGSTASASVSGGVCNLSGSSGSWRYLNIKDRQQNAGDIMEVRFKTSSAGSYWVCHFGDAMGAGTSFAYGNGVFGTGWAYDTANGGTGSWSGSLTYETDKYVRARTTLISSTSINAYFVKESDGSTKTGTKTLNPTPLSNTDYGFGTSLTQTMTVDFVFIRNYAATPPTGAAWSGESASAAAPVAAFSANVTSGAPPLSVAFTDASTNTPTAWNWSWDDGTANGTTQNPTHSFTSAGDYTIILTAANAVGSDSEEKVDYITVCDTPVAAFHANTTSGYAPLSVLFTDDSTGTPTSWAWSWGDGTANGTTQNPSHTYNTSGTYNVTLTATNCGGSDGETKLAYISVYELVAFPGCASVPTDLDADGLYEDINGNTRKDWSDIILFFKYRIWAAANEPAPAFDWNSNGIIDYKDVLMLYDEGV